MRAPLISLIKEAYKVRDNIYLFVDTRGKVFLTDIPSKAASKFNITEEILIKLVEYLIDNIYVSIGNRVYRQCVGIPMGTDCAPLLANLFLLTLARACAAKGYCSRSVCRSVRVCVSVCLSVPTFSLEPWLL